MCYALITGKRAVHKGEKCFWSVKLDFCNNKKCAIYQKTTNPIFPVMEEFLLS